MALEIVHYVKSIYDILRGGLPGGSQLGLVTRSGNPLGFIVTSEQRLTLSAAQQSVTVPAGVTMMRIAAESGDIRFSWAGLATAASAGYLPQGTVEWMGVTAGSILSVYGAATTYANIIWGRVA